MDMIFVPNIVFSSMDGVLVTKTNRGMSKLNSDLYFHGPRRSMYSETRYVLIYIQSCSLTAMS